MVAGDGWLQEDLDRLDRECPGWDKDARQVRAQNALRIGIPRSTVVRIYGEELTKTAEKASGA